MRGGALNIVAIVQARMGSTRLPGKVLADIAGRPALAHVLERAGRIAGVAAVVLAIPRDPGDDVLEAFARDHGVRVVRGDRDDVLDRYHAAANAAGADAVVRITADCPLLDPQVSSRVVGRFVDDRVDYASNVHPPTFPDGYDTEVLTIDALRAAWQEATDAADREHVTPFVWRQPSRFSLANVADTVDRSGWRLTLDTDADLRRIRALCARRGGVPPAGLDEVIAAVGDVTEWWQTIDEHV